MAACTAQGPCSTMQRQPRCPCHCWTGSILLPGWQCHVGSPAPSHHGFPTVPSPMGVTGHMSGLARGSFGSPVSLGASHTSPIAAEVNANLQRDQLKILNRAGFLLGAMGLWQCRCHPDVLCHGPLVWGCAPARPGEWDMARAGMGGERSAAVARELQLSCRVAVW